MDIRTLRLATATKLFTLIAALLAQAGCATTTRHVDVHSTPLGARILIDGVDSGQTTPATVVLATTTKKYAITLEKPGFNPSSRQVELTNDVDVMGPEEAVGRVCISPCCCGFPLLKFLHPVDVNTTFVPARIDAVLEIAGQGARLEVTPTPFEAYVDGKLSAVLDGNYLVMATGDHELEIRSSGCKNYVRSIHVDDRVYQHVKVDLEVEGEGLLLTGTPNGAKVYLDDQYQGNLGDEPRRVRAAAGPHMLRVELDGYKPWQDVVQIVAERYQELAITLRLEGQGVIVGKPEGLPAKTPEIQILVDGQLQGSAFDQPVRIEPGDHEIEIRVTGREPRKIDVRVTKDAYLELLPGPSTNGRRNASQVMVEQQGIRVIEPDDLENDVAAQDVQVLVDGALSAQGFGKTIKLETGDHDVEVLVKGYQPWIQKVHVTKKAVLDVWPRLKKE